eukprot:COSAG01_NODE_8942_length_2608_cov_1.475887_2_plen_227_part_00
MLSTATREIATWNFEFSASANLLLSRCLHELDAVFNVSASPSSRSIQAGTYGTELRFDADFVVSGAIAVPAEPPPPTPPRRIPWRSGGDHQWHPGRPSTGGSSSAAAAAAQRRHADRVVYRVTFRDPATVPVQNQNGALAHFVAETAAEIEEGKLGFVSTPIPGATLLVLPPTTPPGGCKQPSDGKPRCPAGQCDIAGHCRVPEPASACSTRGYWLEMTTSPDTAD